MDTLKRIKGQINIAVVLGWALALVLAAGGSYAANLAANKTEINDLNDKNTVVVQRVATLEEAIQTIKTDNTEIKKDIKTLLSRTK